MDRNLAKTRIPRAISQASTVRQPTMAERALESLPEAVVAIDNRFRVTLWNRAAERTYGWAAAEAVGCDVSAVLKPRYAEMGLQHALSNHRGPGTLYLEAAFSAKDGGLVMTLCEIAPQLNRKGLLTGAVCILRDIGSTLGLNDRPDRSARTTEFLYDVVERLLRQDLSAGLIEETCVTVMRFLGCDIFVNYLAGDGGKLYLNSSSGIDPVRLLPCAIKGNGQGVSGRVAESRQILVFAGGQRGGDSDYDQLLAMGIRAYVCHPLLAGDQLMGTLAFGSACKDSFEVWELALVRVVCGHVAAALHRLGTEANLERMTRELRDKNRLITDFFTNISHEFKTPLSIILVNLQLMEYRMKDAGPRHEGIVKGVAVMRQNALRLLRLIGNLLDVTRIDAGFMNPRFAEADAVELVRGLVESVSDIAMNAALSVRFESNCDSRVMPLDAEKMERVILNLLSNAIKHTPAGGSIEVRLQCGAESVLISVRDTGEGIPLDRQEVIFDRFRQANSSLTRSSEGCGIGLSLARALVELMKGRIWVTSAPGVGSEFCVELPILPPLKGRQLPEAEGMPLSRKLEMEFSDISKIGRA